MANKRYANYTAEGYVFEIFQETDTIKLSDVYNPVVIVNFHECPNNVEVGWWVISGAWYPPGTQPTGEEVDQAKGK